MRQIEYFKTDQVGRHGGTLPVLLACPHGGDEVPPGVPRRTASPPDCPPLELDRDLRTREITTGIAQRLLDLTGEAPSVVIAGYDREYIDANRSAACAFEPAQPSDAQRFYDEYHNTIRRFIDEIRAENDGLGLLFDIHGTGGLGETPADLYLGTVNGLDAIQIEIILPLRKVPWQRDCLVEHLAQAIARLAVLWADARTLAAFRGIELVAGELAAMVAGQLRPNVETGD
jgi:N-formylglutamate amidohydrolase